VDLDKAGTNVGVRAMAILAGRRSSGAGGQQQHWL
jgi:hypothetical protein